MMRNNPWGFARIGQSPGFRPETGKQKEQWPPPMSRMPVERPGMPPAQAMPPSPGPMPPGMGGPGPIQGGPGGFKGKAPGMSYPGPGMIDPTAAMAGQMPEFANRDPNFLQMVQEMPIDPRMAQAQQGWQKRRQGMQGRFASLPQDGQMNPLIAALLGLGG